MHGAFEQTNSAVQRTTKQYISTKSSEIQFNTSNDERNKNSLSAGLLSP
jgi:hypothetical protein